MSTTLLQHHDPPSTTPRRHKHPHRSYFRRIMTVGSAIKNSLTGSSTTTEEASSHNRKTSTAINDSTTTEKYLLEVTAGPSYDRDTHKLVRVNEDTACAFENEFMSVKVHVRIKDFAGLPRSCPPTHSYFTHPSHTSDLYSVSFSFIPKRTLPATHTVWGNDFPHPIRDRLPPGTNTAINIVKRFVDPGLEADAYADEPWLYGPALSCWFAFCIGEKSDTQSPTLDGTTPLEEGSIGSGATIRKSYNMPDTGPARRKWALTASHRAAFTFEAGREYSADFHNGYLDFSDFSLKLPGFSLNVMKYIDNKTHRLRYVFKNRETEEVYFVVVFSLLFGEELAQAVREREERSAGQGEEGGSKYSEKEVGRKKEEHTFQDEDVD